MGLCSLGLARCDFFVDFSQFQSNYGLQEASSVVTARTVRQFKNILGQLSVKFSSSIAQEPLHINKLLEIVKLSIHFKDGNFVVEISVRSVGELDSWEGAGQLSPARDPVDGAPFIEQISRFEVFDIFLLNQPSAENLPLFVFWHKLRRQNLQDNVSLCSLRGNVSIEIRLPGFNGSLDAFQGVAPLHHVPLDLPSKFDFVGDVQVNGEVQQIPDPFVHEGVQPFDDDDWGGFDFLGGVQCAVHVIVDGLHHALSSLQSRKLLSHQIEFLLVGVQSSASRHLSAVSVVQMIIVQTNDSREV
mmetsp:Transcript_20869/g.30950  ORF Transcript_20869/g.30950 Transcript_20869/m.30950 type:complete len:301 (+) Transcript_20869:62-964(+)